MDLDKIKQETIDNEHLRLLALFHYISGALTIVFSSFFIIHLVFMSFLMNNPELFPINEGINNQEVDTEQFISFFVYVFGFFITLGIAFGIAQIISGKYIKKRKNRLFSFIIAIPNIIFIPFGTILAIFTIIVLDKDSVKEQYKNRN